MTDFIYPKWKKALEQADPTAGLNGAGATGVWGMLVNSSNYSWNDDEFYSTVLASGGIVGTPAELTGKTFTTHFPQGVTFDAADTTFPSVVGLEVDAIILFVKNAGANTTWRLVSYMETVTGFPFTPSGVDAIAQWNASGIFRI
jgi:hypothetical protein